jgi:hypothetical protein
MRLQTWDGGFRVDSESDAERQILGMFLRALVALHSVEVDHQRIPGPVLGGLGHEQPIAGSLETRRWRAKSADEQAT